MGAATPWDWVQAIETVARKSIADSGSPLSHVVYEAGANVGPDECCGGVLAIDVVSWIPTTDPWPTQRQPSGPSSPCGTGVANTINVKYVKCVPTVDSHGSLPPEADRRKAQAELMNVGFDLWLALLKAEREEWHRKVGTARVGVANRLPVVGGCSGFTIGVQAKLGTC